MGCLWATVLQGCLCPHPSVGNPPTGHSPSEPLYFLWQGAPVQLCLQLSPFPRLLCFLLHFLLKCACLHSYLNTRAFINCTCIIITTLIHMAYKLNPSSQTQGLFLYNGHKPSVNLHPSPLEIRLLGHCSTQHSHMHDQRRHGLVGVLVDDGSLTQMTWNCLDPARGS